MKKSLTIEFIIIMNLLLLGCCYIYDLVIPLHAEEFDLLEQTQNISLKTYTENIDLVETHLKENPNTKLALDNKIKAQEEARLAAEKKAKEEAERLAKLEEERKAQAAADRYKASLPKDTTGVSTGSSSMVAVAASQIGNVGGYPYWSWYGFNGRVEWCAIFVSWVANQNGYLGTVVPRFAGVGDGAKWFRERGQLKGKGFTPSPGDIIFFDWNQNGILDHVGIVESTDGTYVYTIEGNSKDQCRRRTYSVNSNYIYGYGVPAY